MNYNRLFTLVFFSFFLALAGCATVAPKHITSHDPYKATQQLMQQYGPQENTELRADFKAVGVAFPPKKIALLAFKKERRIELWAHDKKSPWKFIRSYSLTAFSGGPGPKLRYHDSQIPEGIYRITELNPFSLFNLSMELNYPNSFDRAHAKQDGRSNLGNEIFIHGKKLSVGCLAVGDIAITQLFVLVHEVGAQNTVVIIAPNDLRHEAPITNLAKEPKWVPQLYGDIRQRLQLFKA